MTLKLRKNEKSMKKNDILLSILLLGMTQFTQTEIKKVVIWGHKLYSHTHSFIHHGFFKAFTSLGYETYWLDKNDDVSKIDFSNTLFITEGQVDQNIPLRSDCVYVLHNCNFEKYSSVLNSQKIVLQVYTNDCENRGCQAMAPYILYDVNKRVIYMPWATDLLPNEIDQIKMQFKLHDPQKKEAIFIGTSGRGKFGNLDKISDFRNACSQSGINFICHRGLDNDVSINLIKNAYLAPAIQGKWQCDVGYIPCRIFKNISYGQLGITNNKTVYELFNRKIIYNSDTYQLCLDAHARMQTITQTEIFEQIDFVRDNHTYLNRIDQLLKFIRMIVPGIEA